jgi:transketolase
VREIDGHNLQEISETLQLLPLEKGRPSVVIAHTIKGKGVSFMEDELRWHYKAPNTAQLAAALEEVGTDR